MTRFDYAWPQEEFFFASAAIEYCVASAGMSCVGLHWLERNAEMLTPNEREIIAGIIRSADENGWIETDIEKWREWE